MSLFRFPMLAALVWAGGASFACAVDAPVIPASHYHRYHAEGDEGTLAPIVAGDSCNPGGCCCDACCGAGGEGGDEEGGFLSGVCDTTLTSLLFGDDPPVTVGGWVQMGYHNRSTAFTPATSLSFNNVPGRFNLHQGWLYAERIADGSEGLDWGFRTDVVYGVDGTDTQAFGNPTGSFDFANGFDHGIYSWALPQIYGELAAGDLSVKVGHFFTLVGYEVIPSIGNFFYSHSFTMYNSEPFTHTGALAQYKANDKVTLYGGWTLGWDTGFDQLDQGSNFLGGFSAQLMDDIQFTYICTAGNLGWRGRGYSHSALFVTTLTEKLQWVFQSDTLQATETGLLNNHAFGINQYLLYTINDNVKAGGRCEWWRADGVSHYEVTGGLNLFPLCGGNRLAIRPELRHQWAPGFNVDQTIFGVDAYVTF